MVDQSRSGSPVSAQAPHLWQVEHPYYCENSNFYAPGRDQPVSEYESWSEFYEAEGDCDPDMNLLFRFDWRKADPKEKKWCNKEDVLLLYWMGQRKGLYRWSEVKVTDADEPAVREWLLGRYRYLQKLWEPFNALTVCASLRDTLVEAHDTHIYDDDDEHPADCGYCALVAEADAILGPDPARPVVAHVGRT